MPLKAAVEAAGKIENQYRSSAVDRTVAAKLIGYKSLSGPANKALAALAAYGLMERAGKGEARITDLAKSILHPTDDLEKMHGLSQAASEPPLFKEIKSRFKGIPIPPEDGLTTYLNREGFNPTAIKPAAKAFLETMRYLQEMGVSESHNIESPSGADSNKLDKQGKKFGRASVGDLVQWEADGVLQLQHPAKVLSIHESGEWVFVEGSNAGIPMNQVVVEPVTRPEPIPPIAPPVPPTTPLQIAVSDGEKEWVRTPLGKGAHARILVTDDLSDAQIDKLCAVLGAMKEG